MNSAQGIKLIEPSNGIESKFKIWHSQHGVHPERIGFDFWVFLGAVSQATIATDIEPPKKRKNELMDLSNAIENMSTHTKLNVSKLLAEKHLRSHEGLNQKDDNGNREIYSNAILEGWAFEIIDKICEITYEMAESTEGRKRTNTVIGESIITELSTAYNFITGREPAYSSNTPFGEFLCIGLETAGLNHKSPDRLLEAYRNKERPQTTH